MFFQIFQGETIRCEFRERTPSEGRWTMNQYRYKIIKKCFDCNHCVENPTPPTDFCIWMCYPGRNQPNFPLYAANCEGGIPDTCPLPIHNDFQNQKKNYFGGECTCNKFVNCHDCRDTFSSNQNRREYCGVMKEVFLGEQGWTISTTKVRRQVSSRWLMNHGTLT